MIPLTIVTGFLGSGKTTLVAHLLDATEGRRIGVVVNDMATESIDVAYLHGGEHVLPPDSELISAITGGKVGSNRRAVLYDHLKRLSRLEPAPDAVVVETSGSSPVHELVAELTREEPERTVLLDSVVAVVDSSQIGTYRRDSRLRALLVHQLEAADLIVLNKVDRASMFSRVRARHWVRRVNPYARIVTAEFGRLPASEIIATGRRRENRGVPQGTNPQSTFVDENRLLARHLEDRIPFHPERFERWLNGEWPGIERIKGFVWLADDMTNVYVVDGAGSQREIGIEGTWYASLASEEMPDDKALQQELEGNEYGDRRQSITVIGTPEAVEREVSELRRCTLTAPELDRGPIGWSQYNNPFTAQFQEDAETEESE